MSRLIDADALLKYIEENNTEREWVVNKYNADWIWSFIDNAPTIDAEPVRHGRWIFDNDSYSVPTLKCSSCGFTCGLFDYKYCPNCGAKQMDEGVSE